MRFPKFLRVQKFHRRTRSGPRSEIDSIEGQSEAGLAAPRPTESTPDFRTDTPTLSPPSLPIPHDQKSSNLDAVSNPGSPERILSWDAGPNTIPGQVPPVPGIDQSSLPKSSYRAVNPRAVPESTSDRKPTAYAPTKLAIDLVKESSDVFPPLKSVARGLSAILDHCEQTVACREAIKPLIPRVEKLAESLSAPVPEGDLKEEERRTTLKRKLDNIVRNLTQIEQRGEVAPFSNGTEDTDKLGDLVEEIRGAMTNYQVRPQSARSQHKFHSSTPGESPPPQPRTFFGRDKLIEKIVGLAEKFIPIALIGADGIGKTSIALAILHNDRIKQRFGHNRRFIRCDQFPASRACLLHRLSNVIGAGIENPEDLTFLSSEEMLIILDNAESILDPWGTDAQEIYSVVGELGRFKNICVCITSSISKIPREYGRFEVPALFMDDARDIFYRIYDNSERSDRINGILKQLDFHPLSITLLATVAHENKWDADRLDKEWKQKRKSVPRTQNNRGLATTIQLSLASPLFQELGSDALALLEVVAFFPRGVNENNLDWLFPTTSNRTEVFDKFCILSLTYRSDGFITMLTSLRDYLSPKDRKSSLLRAIKERYFTRLSANIDPNESNFRETHWITSEDVNVEYLLDVFTTIDPNSDSVWVACADFMRHLAWHGGRPTILKPKVEKLPDDHSSKPECLFQLSLLSRVVGDLAEGKRLLTYALTLERKRGDDLRVAQMLRDLSDANWQMDLPKEGIQQAEEASKIFERLGDWVGQAWSLRNLSRLLESDKQLDAAEAAASRAINLIPEGDNEFLVSECHCALGDIYRSKGEAGMAIHHLEKALRIASPFDWHDMLFWVSYSLAALLYDEAKFGDAHDHLERAKSYAAKNVHYLGLAMELQAWVWYQQHKFEEARSEALRAVKVYESIGAANDVEDCQELLQDIRERLGSPIA